MGRNDSVVDADRLRAELATVLADVAAALAGPPCRGTPPKEQPGEEPAPAPAVAEGLGLGDRLALSVAEAAKLLGVSRSTAYQLVHTGEIPAIRLAGRLTVLVDELRERLAQFERVEPG